MKRRVKVVVKKNRLYDEMEKAVSKKLDYAAAADSFADGFMKRLRQQLRWIGEAAADSALGGLIEDKD